jgi:hypothetical protein
MTKEEKIEIMFESILSELEKIDKHLIDKKPRIIQNDTGDPTGELKMLIDKLGSIKIPFNNHASSQVIEKLDKLLSIVNLSIDGQGNKEKNHQKTRSTVTLKKSFFGFNIKRLTRVIIILLFGSFGLNIFMLKDYQHYRQSHQKYMFLYYSGNQQYLSELDSLWNIDSLRQKRTIFTSKRKNELN